MSDDEEDDEETPFEQFDEAVGDREGDPFDELGYPDEESADSDGAEDVWEPDQEEQLGGDVPETPTEKRTESDQPSLGDELASAQEDSETRASPDRDPLGGASAIDREETTGDSLDDEMTEEFGAGSKREGDPFESFERMDTGGLDADEVWESLSEAKERGSVTEMEGRTYAEVSKHSYCEHCEFFSAPPNISCSNEGTEILEFIDMETVRVVDCPVVAERRELERE